MNLSLAYLRADVSRSLGLGHISRAIAMAKALERKGIQPVVFCRVFDRDKGHPFDRLSEYRDLIREIQSEEEFISILEQKEGKYLFIDLVASAAYTDLVKRLKPLFPHFLTICFDAFFEEDLKFDLFIRPLFDGTTTVRNALTGLKYYVFPEKLRILVCAKEAPKEVRRVLVTMGGSDPHCISPVLVQALCGAHPEIHFTVVVGPGFIRSVRSELVELAARYRNIRCAVEPQHLGHLYMATDFAITSGGLTKFETALFGIPSFILANTQQEEELSKEFSTLGASVFIGRADQLDLQQLQAEFARLIIQDIQLAEMSRNGQQILDIYGGERVVDYITKALS